MIIDKNICLLAVSGPGPVRDQASRGEAICEDSTKTLFPPAPTHHKPADDYCKHGWLLAFYVLKASKVTLYVVSFLLSISTSNCHLRWLQVVRVIIANWSREDVWVLAGELHPINI